MAIIPTPIPAPPNRQATTGLIALATPADVSGPDGDGIRWEGGFAFDPESCSAGQVLAIDCNDDSTEKTPSTHPPLVAYSPVALVVMDTCSTMDAGRDGGGIARRHLLSRQSALLEAAFWTGVAVGDDTTGQERPHLADGRATVLGTAQAAPHGLAVMDQALTACLGGVPGMVHMSPYTLARMAGAQLLELEGGRWYTPNRHLVVAGAGYTGGGPRPAVGGALPAAPDLVASPPVDQYIYGTAPVFYLLGAADTLFAVDRAHNNAEYVAERPGAAFHGCCQFVIPIDHTPT
jgi:hypothetical protein